MLHWIVGKKLDQIGRHADPDRAFVTALERRIKSELPRRYAVNWKLLAGSLTGISCLFVGTGAYAYTSENVLPGDALYAVREGLERVEMTLAPTPAIRARVTVRQMQRRIREQEIMNAKKRPVNEKQMQRFVDAMEVTIDEADHLDEVQKEGMDLKAAILEEKFASVLEASKDREQTTQAKERIETMLDRQTMRLQARVKKLEEARRKRYKALLNRRSQISETTDNQEQDEDRKDRED